MNFRFDPAGGLPSRVVIGGLLSKSSAAVYTVSVFSETLLDHFRNPRNAGDLPDASVTVEVSNPVCGDVLRLAARLENGRIVAARFRTQGCVASIAASSVLTDLLIGKSAAEARAIIPETIADSLGGLPPASFHAAQLCEDAVVALLHKVP